MKRIPIAALSAIVALVLCAGLLAYFEISEEAVVLPVKVLVAPAFIVGSLLSGNVHQPSVLGAWFVFFLYAWCLCHILIRLVLFLRRGKGPKRD